MDPKEILALAQELNGQLANLLFDHLRSALGKDLYLKLPSVRKSEQFLTDDLIALLREYAKLHQCRQILGDKSGYVNAFGHWMELVEDQLKAQMLDLFDGNGIEFVSYITHLTDLELTELFGPKGAALIKAVNHASQTLLFCDNLLGLSNESNESDQI